jgi:hypothetical protein
MFFLQYFSFLVFAPVPTKIALRYHAQCKTVVAVKARTQFRSMILSAVNFASGTVV